jgi:hypothetical protein
MNDLRPVPNKRLHCGHDDGWPDDDCRARSPLIDQFKNDSLFVFCGAVILRCAALRMASQYGFVERALPARDWRTSAFRVTHYSEVFSGIRSICWLYRARIALDVSKETVDCVE